LYPREFQSVFDRDVVDRNRVLVLTDQDGVFLIEEAENGHWTISEKRYADMSDSFNDFL